MLLLWSRSLVRPIKKYSEEGTRSCQNYFICADFIYSNLSAAGKGLVDALEAVPQDSGQDCKEII